MRIKFLSTFLCLFGIVSIAVVHAKAAMTPEALARKAVSPDRSESGPAVAMLRGLGPKGLDLLFQLYGDQIARLSAESPRLRASDPEWQRLTAALDGVSRQRDSFASHLYWYTDIDLAKAAARASGKPILSLRLLGNLDEEFSCANSRFFRSILYANAGVSAVLRERFILHWKSVRPVPRVTIDFGDGRKLQRTLTGNSIHYILDAEGRPIDAIPGLYGPSAFLRELDQALAAYQSVAGRNPVDRQSLLRAYHQTRGESIAREFDADAARSGARLNPRAAMAEFAAGSPAPAASPTAAQAAPRAMLKVTGEFKTLKLIGSADPYGLGALGSFASNPLASLAPENQMSEWEKIAGLHTADAKLDAASIALIRSQYTSIEAGEPKIVGIVNNLQRYLAIDTVRNEYLMHARLHQWFGSGLGSQDVESLNERVYADLFLTPASDPWLGLVSPDTYLGLVDGGIVQNH
jgi:hypothetical protein